MEMKTTLITIIMLMLLKKTKLWKELEKLENSVSDSTEM